MAHVMARILRMAERIFDTGLGAATLMVLLAGGNHPTMILAKILDQTSFGVFFACPILALITALFADDEAAK